MARGCSMNKEALLGLVEQYLRLEPPVRRTHPDEVGRHQAILGYKRNRLCSFVEFWCAYGCPWPISAALAIEWVSQGTIPEPSFLPPPFLNPSPGRGTGNRGA